LLVQHAKKTTEASSNSGCDDEEFGELEKLLQGTLDLQSGAYKIRSDLKKHEIDEDEKATADDATILAAAGSRRASPLMRRQRRRRLLVASTASGPPTKAAYLLRLLATLKQGTPHEY
jgi:hypothetical protein